MTGQRLYRIQAGWGHTGKVDYDNDSRPKRKGACHRRTMRSFKKSVNRILDQMYND